MVMSTYLKNFNYTLDADVPGGAALMLALEQCKEVLMIPNTASIENLGKYVWRPENEVDLSSPVPFVNLGELSCAADEVRHSLNCMHHM